MNSKKGGSLASNHVHRLLKGYCKKGGKRTKSRKSRKSRGKKTVVKRKSRTVKQQSQATAKQEKQVQQDCEAGGTGAAGL